MDTNFMKKKPNDPKTKQNCSYQGKILNVSTAFLGLWSSNYMKKLNVIK